MLLCHAVLQEPIIGKFPFYSGKAERLHTAHRGQCLAYLFVMHVSEVLPDWPEAAQRKREWVSLQEACSRCRYDWMREALVAWMQRKGWESAAAACLQACSTEDDATAPASAATAAAAPSGQSHACNAIMATGTLPEAAVQPPVERIAIRT